MTDVLIVGARCAGATLAIHLARAGKQVMLVDADDLPSDLPLSTHWISPYGMGLLNELGVGDKVRDIAPPGPFFVYGMDDARIRIPHPSAPPGTCPQRPAAGNTEHMSMATERMDACPSASWAVI